ncbi:Uncharacterised protein [Mycobacteroides abscessus subsp. massiliense]|nr:Uncharacterised protein [Mycobacteroides abscessus subsp. massiliense]
MVCARSASSRVMVTVWMFVNGEGGETDPSLCSDTHAPEATASAKGCHWLPCSWSKMWPSNRSPQK